MKEREGESRLRGLRHVEEYKRMAQGQAVGARSAQGAQASTAKPRSP